MSFHALMMSFTDLVPSSNPITISASEIFWNVRSMPIFSMVSEVSRIPAVSMKRYIMPSIVNVSSIVSRVVPSMSLTMARSSPKMAFRSVLFPVLVSPTIATGMPCFIALPILNESVSFTICFKAVSSNLLSFVRSANSTSSSEKSSSSSKSEVKSTSFERKSRNSFEKPPLSWLTASLCSASFCAAIKSVIASACARSSFPLM